MNPNTLTTAQRIFYLTGRALLGIYFILPALQLLTNFAATSTYMALHGVPLVPVMLVLTIVLHIGCGASLALGYRPQLMAFLLAGQTIIINFFMHDFWNSYAGADQMHETQNFIKNMAVFGGLLFVAGSKPMTKVAATAQT